MSNKIQVVGIAGSLRTGSYNKCLLKIAQVNLPEGMFLEIRDLAQIPLYNADIEKERVPSAVMALKEIVAKSDGMLIAAPEYNRSIPGVLKNTMDWLSTPAKNSPLPRKPLAIMGAGGRLGTGLSQTHLRQVAIANNMYVMNRPEVMIRYAARQFNDQGELVDEKSIEQIRKLLNSFMQWILQFKE